MSTQNKKIKSLINLAVTLFLILGIIFPTFGFAADQDNSGDKEFKIVELDRFIDQEKSIAQDYKKKIIRKMVPVKFDARMKRFPEEKEMAYIYTAMQVVGVNPMPEVNFRMFVESKEGRIIPVYVENKAAAKLKEGLKVEQDASFLGYHVYTYAKGPAILVVDFLPAPEQP
nr:hypothetical protein [uncultured Desulfobacter sp.]